MNTLIDTLPVMPTTSLAPAPSSAAAPPLDNRFDPSRLRLSQDFENKVGVKKAIITVPVRKPDRQWFVRVHPDETWRLNTAVLELKEERETYLVERALWSELPGEVIPKMLFTAVNRQGVTFLWPVRLPGGDGKWDEWNRSAMEAAQMAMKGWVRIAANMSLGAYDVFAATADLPEPVWPEIGFEKLLSVAFKDRFISDLDHPVVRRLRGQI
jgi:hypothetical protein